MAARRDRPRSHSVALGSIFAMTVVTAFIETVLAANSSFQPRWLIMAVPTLGLAWVLCGVIAWRRRPANRLGPLLVFGGWTWLVVALEGTDQPVLVSVAVCFATLPLAVIVHALLAFPSGRVDGRAPRALVLVSYFSGTVLQVLVTFVQPSPVHLGDTLTVGAAVRWMQLAADLGVTVGLGLILVQRLRQARREDRRVLAPLYGYGSIAMFVLLVVPNVSDWFAFWDPVRVAVIQFVLVAGMPLAIAVALLRGFVRISEVQELSARLGRELDRRQVGGLLADALGDPTVKVAFWLPDTGRYVDADAEPVDIGIPGRAHVRVDIGTEHVGVITFDPRLLPDQDAARVAGQVLALALERERLTVALMSSREALRSSGARLAEVSDNERRRIARDLHDGLQSRLVLLALQSADAVDGDVAAARSVHTGLCASIEELRSLVHGVMPSLLLERGLVAAVHDLAERMTIPTAVCGSAQLTLPPTVESTAYFVISEALTNATKHSAGDHVWIRMTVEADRLVLEVEDDGTGVSGAYPGNGLRSIADRVQVLGGRTLVTTVGAGGTLVRAELPIEPATVKVAVTERSEAQVPTSVE